MLKRARERGNVRDRDAAASPVSLQFRDDPLVWAGWLYVQDGLTQNEIADVMGVSRATVNAYLAEARARGIVRIAIDPAHLRATEAAQALKQRLGLADCVVIPDNESGTPLAARLGEAGAIVLAHMLRAGDTLAVGRSRTVLHVAERMQRLNLSDLAVVQAMCDAATEAEISAERCASQMASAIGARCIALNAPALVSTPAIRDLLMAEAAVRERFDRVRGANKLIFGIGTLRRDSLAFTSGGVEMAMVKPHIEQGATAEIAGRFIDAAGRPVLGPIDARMVGLLLDELKAIKVRIAVAGGLNKVAAILACLRGGYATALVTDLATARGILKADGAPLAFERSGPKTVAKEREGGLDAKTKKFINDPKAIIDEMLDGVIGAHASHLRRLSHSPRSIVAVDGPRPGKVGVVIGGGSGHEPTFLGFVGKGLADGCAVGNVFASPPPDPILACAKAVDGGKGVLFLFGNYAGDLMNFEMAVEMAAMDNIEARIVVTTDDIASAPRDQREKRRGVAGNFFVFKAVGAAADSLFSLDECERIARHANSRTFTVGVALTPCSLPQTRTPSFEMGADEMEMGLGIHGEPGLFREAMKPADAIVDDIIDRIFAEMPAKPGDRVAVLVNSLGSTPLMELYVLNRRVRQRLDAKGLVVHETWVGPYCTSLEMAGASVTLMWLDDELTALIDRPCDCAMFRAG